MLCGRDPLTFSHVDHMSIAALLCGDYVNSLITTKDSNQVGSMQQFALRVIEG